MLKKILISIPVLLVAVALSIYFFFPATLFTFASKAERDSANLTQKEITVVDHKIVYLEGGTGETILLLHGFGGNKDNWTRFSKGLTDSYHVIALDLPGWGESSYFSEQRYSNTEQVGRLKKITTALGIDKYHLAGNSMGGAIAGKMAYRFPAEVLSLGLSANAGISGPIKSENLIANEAGKNLLLVNNVKDFDRVLSFIFVTVPEIPRPVKAFLAERSVKRRPINQKIFSDRSANPAALEPMLSQLTIPVMVMWGVEDRVIDVSTVDKMKPLLQNATYFIMENTGHVPMIEKPIKTVDMYRSFLKNIENEKKNSEAENLY